MVKSYQRYELERTFGVISSNSRALWVPGGAKSTRAITAGVEQVLVWDVKTGELVQRLQDGAKVGASSSATSTPPPEVVELAFEPSSQLIAAGCDDGSIKVWDMTSGSVIMVFNGHKSAITQLKFDRSGTRLCSGSRDSSIILWDLVGETGLFKLQGHRDQINGIEFLSASPDKSVDDLEDYLVSTSKDGLIKLWDLKSQQSIETHVAHTGECWALAVDPAAEFAITAGVDNQIKVWKIDLEHSTRKLTELGAYEKQSKARGTDIAFASVSSHVFFYVQNADRTVEVFRVRTTDEIEKAKTKRAKRLKEKGMEPEQIAEAISSGFLNMLICPFTTIRAPAKVRSCVWTVTNKSKLDLLLGLNNNSLEYHTIALPESVRKHNAQTPISERKYAVTLAGHRNDIRSVDISDDDKLLATSSNGQLKIWNTKTNNCIRSFDCGYALTSRFLPGGALVILGTKEGELELYDLASSTLLHYESEAHSGAIWSIEISADGKSFITGSADKTVKFWDIKVDPKDAQVSFEHKRTLELNEDVLCVRLTPDNKLLAVSLLDNTVKVFFQDTLKFFLSLYGHKLPVLSIDISFDSKLIITSSADKNIRIWGLDFGDCHKSIFGHQDSIMCVRFLPESKNFFSCSKDGMVKYWDGIKFECVQKLAAHHSEVWSLAVSSDGDFVASVSHDKSIRLWYQSDDQVFIEEEKEKEMDELYEETLLQSLEGDEPIKKDDEEAEDEVTRASRQTMETLKAGEKLMEALDIGAKEYDEQEQYEKDIKAFKLGKLKAMPEQPTHNPLLVALNVSPEQYVLDTLLKIRAAQLDDSLMVLPFSYTLKLLKFIQVWTNGENISKNITSLTAICRVLFFIVRSNAMELINQKDETLKRQILLLKEQLRTQLAKSSHEIGFNVAGLKYMKQQWNLNHSAQFVDEFKQAEAEEEKSRKRVYTTLS